MKMTWTLYGRKKLCMCNPIFCHRVQVIFIIRISYNGITHTEFLSNIRSRSNIDMGHCCNHLVPQVVEQLNLILD